MLRPSYLPIGINRSRWSLSSAPPPEEMYRPAAKRLLSGAVRSMANTRFLRFPNPSSTLFTSSGFCNHANPPSPSWNHTQNQDQSPNCSDPFSSASSPANGSPSSSEWNSHRHGTHGTGVEYLKEQGRVLRASLTHVPSLGWSKEAMIAGAREVGVSPAVVGSFPRKEAALVEFFMDDCLQRLMDIIETGDVLRDLTASRRISKLVRMRLEMQAPYISKWAQALSVQAHPSNVPTSFKQRAMLVDEIWHAAGDEATDTEWYVKRTMLGGIYSTAEIYMLTDNSTDFRDTWAFLDDRVKDAFDLRNTIQEAKYLVEAASAGTGRSFQGFASQIFAQ